MNHQHTTSIACSRILVLILTLATQATSQQAGPPPIDRTTNTERAIQQDMSRREYQLRNLGNEPSKPLDRRQLEALMVQTEEDFTRILTLHNEIARAISSNKQLDYHFVSDATAEIRKRASRLQTNLVLHEPATERQKTHQENEFKDAELKTALVTLCKHIKDFVTNPVIENPTTVNAEHLARARQDMASLIQLSGKIKSSADKLNKSSKR